MLNHYPYKHYDLKYFSISFTSSLSISKNWIASLNVIFSFIISFLIFLILSFCVPFSTPIQIPLFKYSFFDAFFHLFYKYSLIHLFFLLLMVVSILNRPFPFHHSFDHHVPFPNVLSVFLINMHLLLLWENILDRHHFVFLL